MSETESTQSEQMKAVLGGLPCRKEIICRIALQAKIQAGEELAKDPRAALTNAELMLLAKAHDECSKIQIKALIAIRDGSTPATEDARYFLTAGIDS